MNLWAWRRQIRRNAAAAWLLPPLLALAGCVDGKMTAGGVKGVKTDDSVTTASATADAAIAAAPEVETAAPLSASALPGAALEAPAWSDAPVRLDAAGRGDFFPTGEALREGDILLGRSYGLVGAAISASGDTPGPYSHGAMYFRDAAGRGRILNFRPGGLDVGTPEDYFSRYSRLALVRLRRAPGNPHGFSLAARGWVERDGRSRIPPDFRMDHNDGSALFCIELISSVYRENGLPDPFAHLTRLDADTLLRQAKAIFGLPIENLSSPNSVLSHPDFAVAAEWIRPEYDLRRDALNEGLVDRVFEYVAGGYTPRAPGPGTRLKVFWALGLRKVGHALTFWRDHQPLPDYIDRDDIGRGLVMYSHVAKAKNLAGRQIERETRPLPAGSLERADGGRAAAFAAGDSRVRQLARAAADRFRDRYYLPPAHYSAPLTPLLAAVPNPRYGAGDPFHIIDMDNFRNRLHDRYNGQLARANQDQVAAPATTASVPASMEPAEEFYGIRIGDVSSSGGGEVLLARAIPPESAPAALAEPESGEAGPADGIPAALMETPETTMAALPSIPRNGMEIIDGDEPLEFGITIWEAAPGRMEDVLAMARGEERLSAPADRVAAGGVLPVESLPGNAVTAPRGVTASALAEPKADTETVDLSASTARTAAQATATAAMATESMDKAFAVMDKGGDPADPSAGPGDARVFAASLPGDDSDEIPGLPTLAVLIGAHRQADLPDYRPSLLTRSSIAGAAPEVSVGGRGAPAAGRGNPFLTEEENAALAGRPLPLEELPALPATDADDSRNLFRARPFPSADDRHAAMAPPSLPTLEEAGAPESLPPPALPAPEPSMTPPPLPRLPDTETFLMPMVAPGRVDDWREMDGGEAPEALPPPLEAGLEMAMAARPMAAAPTVDFRDLMPDWLAGYLTRLPLPAPGE